MCSWYRLDVKGANGDEMEKNDVDFYASLGIPEAIVGVVLSWQCTQIRPSGT